MEQERKRGKLYIINLLHYFDESFMSKKEEDIVHNSFIVIDRFIKKISTSP